MYKIIFFIIIFFINSINAKTLEDNKGNLQFEQAKENLEKYCYSCSEKFLQNFEKSVAELEKITPLNSKGKRSTDKEILLTDSYEQLIYDFYKNNKPKQETYRNRQYKLFEQLIKKSQTEEEVIFFAKKLNEAYMREWTASNKTYSDPEHLVYKEKVKKLTIDMRSYVKKIKAQTPNRIHRTCTHKEKPPSQKSIILAWF